MSRARQQAVVCAVAGLRDGLLGDNLVDDAATDVGQALVASFMQVGQAILIETHQPQQRRMDVA